MTNTEFLWAIMSGLTVALIVKAVSPTAKWIINLVVPNFYPRMKGNWIGKYTSDSQEHVEDIEVNQQFLKYFSGSFISIENGERIKYKFKAEFIDKLKFKVSFEPDDNNYNDYGLSLFKLSNNSKSAKGIAVSYYLPNCELESRTYTLTQVNA